MARLPYVNLEEIPAEYSDVAARKIWVYRIVAHSLECARAFGGLGQYIRYGSTIDGRLREMAIIQVGYVVRSPYEFYHHVKIGYDFGMSEADVDAMIEETHGRDSGLPELDRAVLRMARQMTTDLQVDDATFAVLERHFSREHLVDLAITISHYNGVVRFLGCFQVDLEPGYEKLIERFPLPTV